MSYTLFWAPDTGALGVELVGYSDTGCDGLTLIDGSLPRPFDVFHRPDARLDALGSRGVRSDVEEDQCGHGIGVHARICGIEPDEAGQ